MNKKRKNNRRNNNKVIRNKNPINDNIKYVKKTLSFISNHYVLISFLSITYTYGIIFSYLKSIYKTDLLIPSLSSPTSLIALLTLTLLFTLSLLVFCFLPAAIYISYSILSSGFINRHEKIINISCFINTFYAFIILGFIIFFPTEMWLLFILFSVITIVSNLILFIIADILVSETGKKNKPLINNNFFPLLIILILLICQPIFYLTSFHFIGVTLNISLKISSLSSFKYLPLLLIPFSCGFLILVGIIKNNYRLIKAIFILIASIQLVIPFASPTILSLVTTNLGITSQYKNLYLIKDSQLSKHLTEINFVLASDNTFDAYNVFTLGESAHLCQRKNTDNANILWESCVNFNKSDIMLIPGDGSGFPEIKAKPKALN